MNGRFGGVLLVIISASLRAQSPTEPTFHATTKLIQVSVVAQDQDGRPVADLKREDFQLFDNGKPEPIQLFIAEKPASPEPRTPNRFTNKAPQSTGYSVLLFDQQFHPLGEHRSCAATRAKSTRADPADR